MNEEVEQVRRDYQARMQQEAKAVADRAQSSRSESKTEMDQAEGKVKFRGLFAHLPAPTLAPSGPQFSLASLSLSYFSQDSSSETVYGGILVIGD